MGYVLGKEQKLEIDPLTAPIVLEIFTRYADGETMKVIIDDLNSRGLKTKRGKPFAPSSFNAMLGNRKYIGEYRYQDIVIPDGVPAIVPEELFYRVQERREKNKKAPARSKTENEFLLTTKLFCGKCERMMVGESGTSHTGLTYYYYKCGSAKRKKGCNQKAVKKDWLERIVVKLTVDKVLQDSEIDRIADALIALQDKEDLTMPALKQQLATTEKNIENMLNAIQQGILTKSTKARLEELEAQKEKLEISILQAELEKPRCTKELIVKWIKQFKYGDVNSREYQKRIIDTFVNAIYLFEDRMVLTYNFKGGTDTITLSDIEIAVGSDLMGGSPPTFMVKNDDNSRSRRIWRFSCIYKQI